MTRIYTRTGDQGETSLGDGSRVPKSGARIDLYGDVDELNSLLGVVISMIISDDQVESLGGVDLSGVDLAEGLHEIQCRLFDLGSVLANPTLCADIASGQVDHTAPVFPQVALEEKIDLLEQVCVPLKNFILPGGHPSAAHLHVARTVCRRVERKCVQLAAVETIPADAIAWLNRLSDFFFIAARAINAVAGIGDTHWDPPAYDDGADPEEG